MELVVFLGNPGAQYTHTRHNVARLLLQEMENHHSLIWKDQFKGRVAPRPSITPIRFFVPGCFMNESGHPVAAALQYFKISPEQLLVVHDDLELPFGTIGWRSGGGLGGHNGLKSIKNCLGTNQFKRLRLGIGRPTQHSVHSWVLGRFDSIQEAQLPGIFDASCHEFDLYSQSPADFPLWGKTTMIYVPN